MPSRGAQDQPGLSPFPAARGNGAHNQPGVLPTVLGGSAHNQAVVPPSLSVPGASAHSQPVVPPSLSVPGGGAHSQPVVPPPLSVLPVVPPSLSVSGGGAHSQPVVPPAPSVLGGGARNQPVVPAVQVWGAQHHVSTGGSCNQPAFASTPIVSGGGVRNQPGFASPLLVSGGGLRNHPALTPSPAVPTGGVQSQPAFSPPIAVPWGMVRSQPASAPRPAVPGGGVHSQPAFLSRPALPGGGVRSQPAFAPRPALPGGVPAVHSQPAFAPRPDVPGGGVRSQLAASTGFPIEVGTEPRGVSNYPFTPHFNMPPSRRRKLRSLPPLHNFNLVHFKRPITTTSEHNLFLELYMKHATKGGTNYRAVLMEFNSAVAKQLWGLAQGGYQQAIDSDLYFKDYRDITRYERQLVRSLLSREADNTSVALSSALEHASTSPTDATVTPPSSLFPPQTLGCGPLDQGRSNIAASPREQADDPSSGAPENLVQRYTGPLVVRPPGVESSRLKAGNQGGKGVGKKCRKCDPDGSLGIMRGSEHDCPYSKKNTHKRKRE